MLLGVLVEAVNAVADWPLHDATTFDVPVRLLLGYRVGPHEWALSVNDMRRALPEVRQKQAELRRLVRAYPLPLRQYPLDRRARELHMRNALLASAVQISSPEMRRTTAHWITMLGRLRASY